MIESYVRNPLEKEKLFNSIRTIPCIMKLANWYEKHANKDTNSIHERLLASAITEGIIFSGAFCAIFWIKERGLMPGLAHANAEIFLDESSHVNFYVLLLNKLVNKLSVERVYAIFGLAMEGIIEFVTESLPVKLIGINCDMMVQYIKFCSDRLLVDLNYEKLYRVENCFGWMDRINLDYKSNFFEKQVAEYSKGDMPREFSLIEDF